MKGETDEKDGRSPRISINKMEEARIGALPKLLERSESSSNTLHLQKKKRPPRVPIAWTLQFYHSIGPQGFQKAD
jgi:hypothetical protein